MEGYYARRAAMVEVHIEPCGPNTEYPDHAAGYVVEARDAHGYWSVPAWDERGCGELASDFQSKEAAIAAVAEYGFTLVSDDA